MLVAQTAAAVQASSLQVAQTAAAVQASFELLVAQTAPAVQASCEFVVAQVAAVWAVIFVAGMDCGGSLAQF